MCIRDSFNPVRAEYSQMLKKQLAQGNNGLTKTKYLTFGIEAESMRQDVYKRQVPMGEITRALVGVRRRLCVKWGFVDMDVYEQEYRFYYFCLLYTSRWQICPRCRNTACHLSRWEAGLYRTNQANWRKR